MVVSLEHEQFIYVLRAPLGPQNWLVATSAFHMLWNLAFLEFFINY